LNQQTNKKLTDYQKLQHL